MNHLSARSARTGLSVAGAGLLLVAAVGCSSDSDSSADSTSGAASSSTAAPSSGSSSAASSESSSAAQSPSASESSATGGADSGGPVGAAVKNDAGLKNLATKAGCTSSAVKKPKGSSPIAATVASGVECTDASGKDIILMRTKQPGTTAAVGKAFQQQSSAGKPAYLHGDDWILLKDGSGPQGMPVAKDYEPLKAKVGGTVES